ncbi:MAG: HPr family phosphocarrier protein [Candidatus Polarisedimenticolaceae bacterium]|nr:HPr family phosphocarrier protein [Candidatus Polarisedimenticolaceae bacterium]
MIKRDVTIINKLGLHARAAAKLVSCASQFESEIFVERNGHRVNGKSIMGVMMLAASQGVRITLEAEGDDEELAVQALQTLIIDRFGEGA